VFHPLYIQLLSNLLIPVLGFWMWNWSLYFILLFYILDIVSSEMVHFLKIRKIKTIQKQSVIPVPTKVYSFVSLLFIAVIIVEINIGMKLYHPELVFGKEIWDFLMYKEMGIPQGFVLLPLVGLMAYTSYKAEFLMPKLYLHQAEKPLWKYHLKAHFLLLAFCAVLTLLAVAYQFPEWVALTVILVVTTGYNYLQGRERMKGNYIIP
jgi:hypothetical protein